MNIHKGFFDIFEERLIESLKKLGTLLQNRKSLEMNEIDNGINKSCSPRHILINFWKIDIRP